MFTALPAGVRTAKYCERVCMLSLCLSVSSDISKTVQTSGNFLYILAVADVARSSSDDSAVRSVLPVLWMTSRVSRGATTFSKLGVQFLGLGYYTEHMDGIPSFVHCSVLRNGNHTLHQESWGGPSKFFGGPDPQPPSGCALACIPERLKDSVTA